REERRLDLAVAVLARVEIEHEIDEGAREARTRAGQDREARRRHLDRALEVEDAERWAEVPVRLWREVERSRRAVTPPFHVVRRALPLRHALVRQVRQVQHRRVALVLDRIELNAELLDLRRTLLVGLLNVRGVVALPLRPRNLVARRVLLAF